MAEEPSTSAAPGGGTSTPMARTAHGEIAAAAAAHLTASGYTDEGFSRDKGEIDRQAPCLIEWARSRHLILDYNYTSGLKKHPGVSAEHEVFYRSSDDRAVKKTYAGTFGVTPDRKGDQTAATPLFYLRRLLLFNKIFLSDLRVEGFCLGGTSLLIGAKGEQVSIILSQKWITALDQTHPHPSLAKIENFMKSLGFTSRASSYFGWYRAVDDVTVLDARPDNFILSAEGIVPIDLVVSQSRRP